MRHLVKSDGEITQLLDFEGCNTPERPGLMLPINRPSDQPQPRWGNLPRSLFLIPIHLMLVGMSHDALAAVRR